MGSQFPGCVVTDGLLRAGGKLHFILETKDAHHVVDELENTLDLGIKLIRGAEDMGIILGETAYPHQSVQHTGPLMAVNRAQLEITQGQVTVAAQLGLVDHHVGKTVHRFYTETLLIYLGEIHILAVVLVVAGTLPQLGLEYLRAHYDVITALEMFATFKILQDRAQHGPFG